MNSCSTFSSISDFLARWLRCLANVLKLLANGVFVFFSKCCERGEEIKTARRSCEAPDSEKKKIPL